MRKGPQANAMEFNKLVRLPRANNLILKRLRSSIGCFSLLSTNINARKSVLPKTRRTRSPGEVGSPIVQENRMLINAAVYSIDPL